MEIENDNTEYAAKDIVRVELYLMFSTDFDFSANLDGLAMFINSRLGDDTLIYDFRVKEEIRIMNYGNRQFIKLSVELPIYVRNFPSGHIPNSRCYFHRNTWAKDAIYEVLLPAYMWIFAEIGVGNSLVASNFKMTAFEPYTWATTPMENWLKSGFTDGVRLSSRCETMSGNYGDSWAQFRFVLDDAKDYGDSMGYINNVIQELENKYRKD